MKIGKLYSQYIYIIKKTPYALPLHLTNFYRGFVHDFVFFVFTFVTLVKVKEWT